MFLRLNREVCRYSTFLDIHKLWSGYMSELLNLPALASIESLETYLPSHVTGMQSKLVKADFHGCKMTGVSPATRIPTHHDKGDYKSKLASVRP